ncbi:MAG: ABC transporter ATP-binding protein [Nitrospira sp.]|nr:ABC transporter ATP-binding protein [Nitrospira sp.]
MNDIVNPIITFEAVRKEYGRFVAVHPLDLAIQAGEIYGLIGPNGAGKTTLIRMACGLLAPTSGHVYINGIEIHRQAEAAQQSIGYLSDIYALYEDLTAWEYLDYFAHAYRMPPKDIPDRIKEVLTLVGLESKEQALTKGLSRGMRQRLGLARAILHRPKLLLLDEPASGLDPKARMQLRDLLVLLKTQGTTIVISSHILAELEGFCTAIGIMELGRLVRSDTLSALTSVSGNRRILTLRWLSGDAETVQRAIEQSGELVAADWSHNQVLCTVNLTEEQLADLHARLVHAGVRIVEFAEKKQTVQDVYMNLSRHEVM